MALIIDIDKISEDDTTVTYSYRVFNHDSSGRFTLRVADGTVVDFVLADGDTHKLFMGRSIYKVQKALARGIRPDHVMWAS